MEQQVSQNNGDKKLKAQIAELQKENDALKAENASLKKQLADFLSFIGK